MSFFWRGKTLIYISVIGTLFNLSHGPARAESLATIEKPAIVSDTHPDASKWYSNPDPVFHWNIPEGVASVRLVLSKFPNTAPRVSYTPAISKKTLTDIKDGIWYLSAQFGYDSGLGPISSFQFRVDTKAPEPFAIARIDRSGSQPQIQFTTTDVISGVQKYEVQIGSGSPLTLSTEAGGVPYSLPSLEPGNHKVVVSAIDAAGNVASSAIFLNIVPAVPTSPVPEDGDDAITDLTGRSWPVISVIILLGLLALLLLRRKSSPPSEDPAQNKIKLLEEDMNGELEMFKKIAKGRPLYPEEQYLVAKLGAYKKIISSLHPAIQPIAKKRIQKKKPLRK